MREEFELVFKGPKEDISEDELRKLRVAFVSDLRFTVDEAREFLENAPTTILRSEDSGELELYSNFITRAGGEVLIVKNAGDQADVAPTPEGLPTPEVEAEADLSFENLQLPEEPQPLDEGLNIVETPEVTEELSLGFDEPESEVSVAPPERAPESKPEEGEAKSAMGVESSDGWDLEFAEEEEVSADAPQVIEPSIRGLEPETDEEWNLGFAEDEASPSQKNPEPPSVERETETPPSPDEREETGSLSFDDDATAGPSEEKNQETVPKEQVPAEPEPLEELGAGLSFADEESDLPVPMEPEPLDEQRAVEEPESQTEELGLAFEEAQEPPVQTEVAPENSAPEQRSTDAAAEFAMDLEEQEPEEISAAQTDTPAAPPEEAASEPKLAETPVAELETEEPPLDNDQGFVEESDTDFDEEDFEEDEPLEAAISSGQAKKKIPFDIVVPIFLGVAALAYFHFFRQEPQPTTISVSKLMAPPPVPKAPPKPAEVAPEVPSEPQLLLGSAENSVGDASWKAELLGLVPERVSMELSTIAPPKLTKLQIVRGEKPELWVRRMEISAEKWRKVEDGVYESISAAAVFLEQGENRRRISARSRLRFDTRSEGLIVVSAQLWKGDDEPSADGLAIRSGEISAPEFTLQYSFEADIEKTRVIEEQEELSPEP